MPSTEPSTLSHTPLSFAFTSSSNETFPSLTSSHCSALSPAIFPESVFGWPALVLAVQSALASFPFLRHLPLFATSPEGTPISTQSSCISVSPMSQGTIDTVTSFDSSASDITMGSQPSTDITMSPVSFIMDDSTSSASETCATRTSSTFSSANATLKPQRGLIFTALPDELIAMCYADLSAADLVALEHVSRRLRHLIAYDPVCWKRCTETRWGHLSSNSAILSAAARHAGTWKQLYSEKALNDRKNAPWLTLSKSETSAILDIIKGEKIPASAPAYWPMVTNSDPFPSSPPKDGVAPLPTSSPVSVMTNNTPVEMLSVVLLIDASSSVTDEDFDAMKKFALALVENLRSSHPEAFVAVVQFNQHPKVEVGLTNVCKSKLSTSIENMEQLMGSTDIAAPIRRARQMLGEDEVRPGDKAIVLLTDGQTHADELRESEREAQKASEEVGARLYTLGVGRDIDEVGLGRVASGSDGGMHFTLRRLVPSK